MVLGLVQGLTEFLPISSSGHLRIVPALLGWEDPGAGFTAVIQLGTMAAVLIYFRADLWRIAAAWLSELRVPIRRASQEAQARLVHRPRHDPDRDLRLHLQGPDRVGRAQPLPDRLGADPLLLRDVRSPSASPAASATLTELDGRDGLFIGLAQALALIPGVSRSGATISAGLFRGLDRVAAARYSFLLSVPAVVLSGLFELRKVGEAGSPSAAATVIATLVAFVTGYAGDRLAAALPRHPQLEIFVVYRIALGVARPGAGGNRAIGNAQNANGPGQWAVRGDERSLVRSKSRRTSGAG